MIIFLPFSGDFRNLSLSFGSILARIKPRKRDGFLFRTSLMWHEFPLASVNSWGSTSHKRPMKPVFANSSSRITFEQIKLEKRFRRDRVPSVTMRQNIYVYFDLKRSRSKFDLRLRSFYVIWGPKYVMMHINRSVSTTETHWARRQRSISLCQKL